MGVPVRCSDENQSGNKHVEDLVILRLDEGSKPSDSTLIKALPEGRCFFLSARRSLLRSDSRKKKVPLSIGVAVERCFDPLHVRYEGSRSTPLVLAEVYFEAIAEIKKRHFRSAKASKGGLIHCTLVMRVHAVHP